MSGVRILEPPPRVPVHRTKHPESKGYQKPVFVPDVLKTVLPNGKKEEIRWDEAEYAIDVDGLLWNSEPFNDEGWKHSYRVVGKGLGQNDPDLIERGDRLIDQVFDPNSGIKFADLAGLLFNIFGEAFGFRDRTTLEEALSDVRDTQVLQRADQGEFGLLPGARNFLEMYYAKRWKRGLVTANAGKQVNALAETFLGDDANRLIPLKHRHFGRELVQLGRLERNKPDPGILKYLVDGYMGPPPEGKETCTRKVVVVDDRKDFIIQAILTKRILAAIWVHRDVADARKLTVMKNDLLGALGPRLFNRVLLAPSLDLVEF